MCLNQILDVILKDGLLRYEHVEILGFLTVNTFVHS